MSMISIIVPVYNGESTLSRCLNAIYSSSLSNFEVILVDDKSKDNSIKVAKKYPLTLIKLQKRSGAATARNIGTKHARGDLLVFVDSDVMISKMSLKITEEFFKENDDIACMIGINNPVMKSNLITKINNLFDYYLRLNLPKSPMFPHTSYMAIKRDIFCKIGGFKEKIRNASAEDVDLGLSLIHEGYIIYLNKKVIFNHIRKYSCLSCVKRDFIMFFFRAKVFLKNRHKRRSRFASSIIPVNILITSLMVFFIISVFILEKSYLIYTIIFANICLFIWNSKFLKMVKENISLYDSIFALFLIMFRSSIWAIAIVLGSISYFLGGKY